MKLLNRVEGYLRSYLLYHWTAIQPRETIPTEDPENELSGYWHESGPGKTFLWGFQSGFRAPIRGKLESPANGARR